MCDNADSEILKNDVTIIYNNLVIKNNFGGCKVKNKFCLSSFNKTLQFRKN